MVTFAFPGTPFFERAADMSLGSMTYGDFPSLLARQNFLFCTVVRTPYKFTDFYTVISRYYIDKIIFLDLFIFMSFSN